MGVDRDTLEMEALQAVSVDDYYELCDTLSETTDEELQMIVAAANQPRR